MALIELRLDPSRRELRLFAGVWFPLFFALLSGLVWHRTGSLPAAAALGGSALALAAVGLAAPGFARLLYVGMLYAVYPIGWTVSTLILASIYYLLITPLGLAMRAVRRDALRLRRARDAESHWVAYRPPERAERYFGQF
jgi:hypothetical protein